MVTTDPGQILRDVFGFPEFRPSQEAVCCASIAGRDVLLVMPTGSGKSLCYQLPTLARSGTALVVSPLIALMEDQVAKLQSNNLRVDRIHSGLPREQSRAAFRAYLDGQLQFLFVAPERFRVPGFLPALTRHKPSLIAVDEAHCISQWGHDFRLDYRMLKECIAALRPTPVMALTATATRTVQRDIAEQLALHEPAVFVQGFRRDNIAIEVVEVGPSERLRLVWKILDEADRRPAILYAPSRKGADEIAAELSSKYRVAAYHAGLDARSRHQVQERFLAGELEVVVATVAFGMGIDKADVRTVVHLALPGSVEAYYQEIGRAGRDGRPSRAVLLQSYADRRTHDFFYERDYPEPDVLAGLHRLLSSKPLPKTTVYQRSRLMQDVFEAALDKLWIHGGAIADAEENLWRGNDSWKNTYELQRNHRSEQVELMLRFAASCQCRMSSLVRYFGDATDKKSRCDMCDFCAPEACVGQQFRDATSDEENSAWKILDFLRSSGARSTGKVHQELFAYGTLSRDDFEEVLGALARAGLVAVFSESFEKDGRDITYRSVRLTPEGSRLNAGEPLHLVMKSRSAEPRARRLRQPASSRSEKVQAASKPVPMDDALTTALRRWRIGTAKQKGVPAFRIFTDRVLQELADLRPASEDDLLMVRGVGARFVEQFGSEILKVIRETD